MMVDASLVLLTHLEAQSALTALTSTRIWAETSEPPPSYKPSDGQAICFKTRGGTGFDEQDAIYNVSFQFKCYGATRLLATELFRTLNNILHSTAGIGIKMGNLEAPPETLQEPDTGWYFTLAFYTVMVTNS